jgi:uncharacterized RDD family membrane protein YckC
MMTMTSTAATKPTVAIQADTHVTGRRVVATIVDAFVIGALYTTMAATFGTITTDGGASHWVATMPAAGTVAYAVVVALYFVLLEGYRGQTLGKMVVGIKVVSEATGAPPGLAGGTVRTALRCWSPPSASAWATWRHTPSSSAPDPDAASPSRPGNPGCLVALTTPPRALKPRARSMRPEGT